MRQPLHTHWTLLLRGMDSCNKCTSTFTNTSHCKPAKHGAPTEVVWVQICYHRQTGKPLGYAVVHFTDAACAQHAMNVLNNAQVDGRQIVVAPYRSRVSDPNAQKKATPHRSPSAPGTNESFGLILDLHKSATWMCALVLSLAALVSRSPGTLQQCVTLCEHHDGLSGSCQGCCWEQVLAGLLTMQCGLGPASR